MIKVLKVDLPFPFRSRLNTLITCLAVAYQFATIGNDKGARALVKQLDDDQQLGDYIDCMRTYLGTFPQ
jgi:hypothetical protein